MRSLGPLVLAAAGAPRPRSMPLRMGRPVRRTGATASSSAARASQRCVRVAFGSAGLAACSCDRPDPRGEAPRPPRRWQRGPRSMPLQPARPVRRTGATASSSAARASQRRVRVVFGRAGLAAPRPLRLRLHGPRMVHLVNITKCVSMSLRRLDTCGRARVRASTGGTDEQTQFWETFDK
jgi:hypothetical protein